MCRLKNKTNSCLRDKNSMITLKEKPGGLFKANVWLREKLSKAEMERGRVIWDNRNSAWAAMYETNGPVNLKWKAKEYLKN